VATEQVARSESASRLLVPVLAGAAVAVAAGTYAQVHDPTGENLFTLFFSATLNLKAWFATAAVLLALFQISSALVIYGKIPVKRQPAWLGDAHRLSGTLAFLCTLPVSYHCLWSLGWAPQGSDDTRVFVHSIAGCFFYGAITAKVIIVRDRRLPGWALPIAGGAVFTALIVLWYTSSLWFFREIGFPEI
jgi:hypothetical protein